jgi:hypothetical protein
MYSPIQYNPTHPLVTVANNLFSHAHNGIVEKLAQKLFGSDTRLQEMDKVMAGHSTHRQHYAGLQTIALSQVRGSESRSEDFDSHFHIRRNHTQSRWISIALARLNGKEMPPIQVIQINNTYYVRDGHHRISVAHALGEQYIEAEVTVVELL